MEANEIRLQAMDLNQQAALLIKAGNLSAAKELLDRAIDLDPMLMVNYKNLGDLNIASENYQEAKNAYKKAILIEKDGQLYFLYGNACFLNDEPHEGLEYYNMAISNGFDNDEMMYFMGLAYEHLNDPSMALRYFQKASMKNPSRPDYLVKKIQTELGSNLIDDAEKDTEELLKIAPELFEAYHIRTQIYLEKGEQKEAMEFARNASEKFPEDADLCYDYAKTAAINKELDKAISLMDQAAQMKYYEAAKNRFLILKAECLAEQGKFDDALAVVLESFEQETKETFSSEAHFLAMNLQLTKNDFEKALEQANLIVNKNAEDMYYFASLYFKASCLRKLGKEEEAEQTYREAIRICRVFTLQNPEAVDVYLYRAMCLRDIKEYDKALEMTDFIIDLGVEMAQVYVIKADILEESGKHASADQVREKAYQIDPSLRPSEQK